MKKSNSAVNNKKDAKQVKQAKQSPTKQPVKQSKQSPVKVAMGIIILVIIIVAFVLGPVIAQANPEFSISVFGTYRGRDISYTAGSYIIRAYEAQYNQAASQAQQAGREVGFQDIYNAMRSAYDATVYRYGMLDFAENVGLNVSENEITDTLTEQFRDEEGNFLSDLYRQTLNSDPSIINEIQDDIIFEKVRQDLFESPALIESEIQFISQTAENRRIFDIVSYEFADYPDEELSRYVEENETLFQRIELSSITSNTEMEANDIRERIVTNESTFDDLVDSSIDFYADLGGSRGEQWYTDLQNDFVDSEIIDAIFQLGADELSEVYQTLDERFVFFRADAVAVQPDTSDSAVIDQARSYVLRFERGRIADYFAGEAEALTSRVSEQGWTNALSQSELSAETTSDITINYGNSPLFPSLASASSNILTDATRESLFIDLFSLEQDETTVVELSDSIAVVRYNRESEYEEDQSDFLSLYLPILKENFLNEELTRRFSSPENLDDNFDEAFQEIFTETEPN